MQCGGRDADAVHAARAKRGQSTKNKMRPPRAPFSLTRAVVTSASRSREVTRRGMVRRGRVTRAGGGETQGETAGKEFEIEQCFEE